MEFKDQTIACADCNSNFIFSAGEQEFFQEKGLSNAPKRCPQCRKAKKQRSRHAGSGKGKW